MVGSYSLLLTLNGQNYATVADYNLHVKPALLPLSIFPTEIFSDQLTEVKVQLDQNVSEYFQQNTSIVCEVGYMRFVATVSNNMLTCSIQVSFQAGPSVLNVEVASTAQSLLQSPILIRTLNKPLFKSMFPTFLYVNISSNVTIEGFFGSASYDCIFASAADMSSFTRASPLYLSSTGLACALAWENYGSMQLGSFDQHMMIGVVAQGSLPLYLTSVSFLPPFKIYGTQPLVLIEALSSDVALEGDNFSDVGTTICQTGAATFPAKFVSRQSLFCVGVRGIETGELPLVVVSNGVTQVSTTLNIVPRPQFTPALSRVYCPFVGSAEGVVLRGNGFQRIAALIQCLFGAASVPAIEVDDSEIRCPCMPGDDSSRKTSTTLALRLVGTSLPFFTVPLIYYDASLTNTTQSGVVIAGQILALNLSVDSSIDRSMVACRLAGTEGFFQALAVKISNFSHVSCLVTCTEAMVGVNYLLQLSIGTDFYTDVMHLLCSPSPAIVSFDPRGGIEGQVMTQRFLISSPLPLSTTDQAPICVVDDIETPALYAKTLYSVDGVFLDIACSVPLLSVGTFPAWIRFGSIVTASVLLQVVPLPMIAGVVPLRLPADKAVQVEVSLTDPVLASFSTSFSYLLGTKLSGPCFLSDELSLVCSIDTSIMVQKSYNLEIFLNLAGIGVYVVEVVAPLQLSELRPSAALAGQSAPVLFFINSDVLVLGTKVPCLFGPVNTTGVVVSPSSVLCPPPEISTATTLMASIIIYGVYLKSVPFMLIEECDSFLLDPTFGSVKGGTAVVASASTFLPFSNYNCNFGSISVPATYIASGRIKCVSPAASVGDITFTISVSNTSLVLTPFPHSFVYVPELILLSSSPSMVTTGDLVQLYTLGFDLRHQVPSSGVSKCRVGTYIVEAVVSGPHSLACRIPSPLSGSSNVNISVAANGKDYTQPLQLEYISVATLTGLFPWHGRLEGGTSFFVSGVNFPAEAVSCVFGGILGPGVRFNTSSVGCVSIASETGGTKHEIFLLFGHLRVGPSLFFQSDDAVFISGISPTDVTATSITPQFIQLFGGEFFEFADQSCRVGTETTRMIWISSTEVLCRLPAILSPGSCQVFLSTNNVDLLYAGTILIKVETAIYSIWPSTGPMSGYSMTTILGTGFEVGLQYVCIFGSLTISSTLLNLTHLQCLTPPYNGGDLSVPVAVSCVNTTTRSINLLFYTYTAPLKVLSVFPLLGAEHGSTIVSITFMQAVKSPIICSFGSVEALSTSSSKDSNIVYCASPGGAGHVEILISVNGVDFEGTGFFFEFIEVFTSIHVSPTTIFVGVNTSLTFHGKFSPERKWTCSIGGATFSEVTWISESLLLCPSLLNAIGTFSTYVSFNNVDMIRGPDVVAEPAPYAVFISPSYVWFGGGQIVSLNGFFPSGIETYILQLQSLNFEIVRRLVAVVENATTLSFSMPSWPMSFDGNLSVDYLQLSLLHDDFGSTQFPDISLIVHPDIALLDIQPRLCLFEESSPLKLVLNIAILADSIVEISTDDFMTTFSAPPLMFPNSDRSSLLVMPPSVAQLSQQYVNLPLSSSIVYAALRIRLSTGYLTSALSFQYMNLTILNISSNFVTESSGEVVVQANNWPSYLPALCKLGIVIVPSTPSPVENLIVCSFTPIPMGSYMISLSPNNGSDWIDSDKYVDIVTEPRILEIVPSMGPISGLTETLITLIMNNDMPVSGAVFCSFGIFEVSAEILYRGTVKCSTPAIPMAANLSVNIFFRSALGKIGQVVSSSLQFQFYDPISLFMLSPAQGSSNGKTMVSITGSNFINSDGLVARFLTQSDESYLVPAVFISSSKVSLITPSNIFETERTFVDVSVSNNGMDFSADSLSFYWDDSVVVLSSRPKQVLESGGQAIYVEGTGFSPSYPSALRCRFDRDILTEAILTAYDELQCVSPAHAPGEVSLEISTNGFDFEYVGMITFISIPQLVEINPTGGPWRGGTQIVVSMLGIPLNSTLDCLFGDIRAPSIILSATSLACTTPGTSFSIDSVVSVGVFISSGSGIVIPSTLDFHYIADPILTSVSILSGPFTGTNDLKSCS